MTQVPKDISLDLAARWVLMSAHLYYDRNCSLLSDADFDSLCMKLCDNWDSLSPFRQWQLGGDPLDLITTAHHVKVTRLTTGAAKTWYESQTGYSPESPYFYEETGFSAEFNVGWTSLGG